MNLRNLIRERRDRALLLIATATAWAMSAVGAFAGHRAVLAVGLAASGVFTLVLSKLALEILSASASRSHAGSTDFRTNIERHDRQLAELSRLARSIAESRPTTHPDVPSVPLAPEQARTTAASTASPSKLGVQPRAGAQTIYGSSGDIVFLGQWDSRELFRTISGPDSNYWQGKRVIDIGANTFGLSIEIARAGAEVVALEPDPYNWSFELVEDIVKRIVAEEGLGLTLHRAGLFEADQFGSFDAALLLGIIYHFRDPQYLLDFLSTLEIRDVIVSSQTSAGDDLVLHNRRNDGTMPESFWSTDIILSGWHPTHPLLQRMLRWAGFDNITPLTDQSINFPKRAAAGLTNSAYYRATKVRSTDPIESRRTYLPR